MRKWIAAVAAVGVIAVSLSTRTGAQQASSSMAAERLIQLAERQEHQRDAMLVLLLGGLTIGALLHWRGTRRITELESMSLTDPLTRVRNRRYLEQTIDLDVAASLRA